MHITIASVFKDQEALREQTAQGENLRSTGLRLALISAAGLGIYGAVMGANHSVLQALSSAIKLPILFFLTLAITLPAFHFISLHAGSRSRFSQTLVLVLNGLATTAILSVAFTPIVVFFMFSSDYSFMLLLNVGVLAFCSVAGAMTIRRNVLALSKGMNPSLQAQADVCLIIWIFLYAFVGTQLAFMMSPFVGREDGFILFAFEEGNFYSAVGRALVTVFIGK